MQQLLVRAKRPNACYCVILFNFMRAMAVKYPANMHQCFFVNSMGIVPVGEPEKLVSITVLGRGGALVQE